MSDAEREMERTFGGKVPVETAEHFLREQVADLDEPPFTSDNQERAVMAVLDELDRLRATVARLAAELAQLRHDFPPAPPLPTFGCPCRTCEKLRERQDTARHADKEKP